jgi:hypothetical protein
MFVPPEVSLIPYPCNRGKFICKKNFLVVYFIGAAPKIIRSHYPKPKEFLILLNSLLAKLQPKGVGLL